MSTDNAMTRAGDSDIISHGGFIEQQTRGEIDTQIATAKRFPRALATFKKRATELATLDDETAQSCFYTLPRDGKTIEGPSVRLAEIVAASWGNLRSQANIIDEDDKFITARGLCWDLENNVANSVEVRRRITNKQGRRFNDDMIATTANAACSIAHRNAVFKTVPMAIVKPIYEAARRVAIGDATTLGARRDKAIKAFGSMGVKPEQIYAKLGRAGAEDVNLDDLAMLLGLFTAIRDGEATVDDTFAPVAKTSVAEVVNQYVKTDSKTDSATGQEVDRKRTEVPGSGQTDSQTDKTDSKTDQGEGDGERRGPLMLAQVLDNIGNATKVSDVVDAAFGHDHLTPDELEVIQKAKRSKREELLRRK